MKNRLQESWNRGRSRVDFYDIPRVRRMRNSPYITFPMVSSRAPPTGHFFSSMAFAFRCSQYNRTLLPMSKTESMPVARRESEAEDTAAYTESTGVGQRTVPLGAQRRMTYFVRHRAQNLLLGLLARRFLPEEGQCRKRTGVDSATIWDPLANARRLLRFAHLRCAPPWA